MRRNGTSLRLAFVFAAMFALACGGNVFDSSQKDQLYSPLPLNQKVDVLFVIDNSSSMTAKQAQLQQSVQILVNGLQKTPQPYWLHLGFITSDLGANGYHEVGNSCHPGGDGGKLQAMGAAAPATCVGLNGGARYIDYNQITLVDGNPTSNLPEGVDLATQIDCMTAMGSGGCGFEHQLESAYVALTDHTIAENVGFLRDDALLVVLFLTDEDDCSALPDSKIFDSSDASLAPPSQGGLGAFDSFRCTKFSIACGNPPTLVPYAITPTPLADCKDAPAAINELYPVQRYIDLFGRPASQGGIKMDPRNVVVFDISATDDTVEVTQSDPDQMHDQMAVCPVLGDQCIIALAHSCYASNDPTFFGDPAVRIRQVVRAVAGESFSICDDKYADALDELGDKIVQRMSGGCLDLPLPDPSNPQCTVTDTVDNSDGTMVRTTLPRCDQNGDAAPCWQLQSATNFCPPVCARGGDTPQQFSVGVVRVDPLGPGVTTSISCEVITQVLNADDSLPVCAGASN